MSDVKAKMYQIQFRLGIRPRSLWGSLQRSPDPLAGLRGPTSKGRGGNGTPPLHVPPIHISGYAPALSDLEWLSKIFNDTKRRAVSLRQLGFLFHMYNRTGGHIYSGYSPERIYPGRGPIWLDNVECIGYERSIAECRHNGWGVHNCRHSEDVSISCSNNGKCNTLDSQEHNFLVRNFPDRKSVV